MRCLALFVILFALAGCCSTELRGRVVGTQGQPVTEAEITVGNDARALLDDEGRFVVEGLPCEGAITVRITAPGYPESWSSLEAAGGVLEETFVLGVVEGVDDPLEPSREPAPAQGAAACPACETPVAPDARECPSCHEALLGR